MKNNINTKQILVWQDLC